MIKEGIILVISSLGVVQALFLSIYLIVVKNGNQKANFFLALVLLGLTLRIGKSIFHNYLVVDPLLRNLAIAAMLAVGPFLWFYLKILIGSNKNFSQHNYVHLLPFFVFVLCSPIIPNKGDITSYIAYSSILLHLGIYLILCWMYLLKFKTYVGNKLWLWCRNITIGVTVILCLYVGIFMRWIPFYLLGAISYSFLIYLFLFLLLKKHVFMLEKYGNSNLDRVTSERIFQNIKTLFIEQEIFRDNSLSLVTVAQQLKLAPRIVSQVVNENENKNFSEFVNSFRIERSKQLLREPEYFKEKIATIAYDSGFGNVTSFNLAFKTATKMTPSAYRNMGKDGYIT